MEAIEKIKIIENLLAGVRQKPNTAAEILELVKNFKKIIAKLKELEGDINALVNLEGLEFRRDRQNRSLLLLKNGIDFLTISNVELLILHRETLHQQMIMVLAVWIKFYRRELKIIGELLSALSLN